MTPLNVVRIASHSSTGMKKRTLARTLGIEDAEAGAGAMLVGCRVAGLSALEAHYGVSLRFARNIPSGCGV